MKSLGIGGVIDNGGGNALIYTALISAFLANMLPTPADSLYFRMVNKLERKFDEGKIGAEELEWKVAGGYYFYTAGWYALLFAGIYSFGGEYKNNARILLALAAGGLVLGAVNKNIEVDKAIAAKKSGSSVTTG